MMILLTILIYFAALFLFSRLTNKNADNDTFFRGNRKSPWYMVAFGMVGASISGVTFVSVPGMVMRSDMTYLQACLGFIFGYAAVAFVLLPVYYRHNLTTIYSYLDKRLGTEAYKTGSWFFILSKMSGLQTRSAYLRPPPPPLDEPPPPLYPPPLYPPPLDEPPL